VWATIIFNSVGLQEGTFVVGIFMGLAFLHEEVRSHLSIKT